MKIRMEGTAEECEQAAPRLAELFEVVSVSDHYPNRGRSLLVRVYVEVRLGRQRDVDQEAATPPPRATIRRPRPRAARTLTASARHLSHSAPG